MDGLGSLDSFIFEGLRFDRASGCLVRADGSGVAEPVALGSRALAVLALLVERQGQLVSKDAIFAAVWPGIVVGDGNLTVQISALRRVLDRDRTHGSCIQTVPGRGYRFIPPVTRAEGDGIVGAGVNIAPAGCAMPAARRLTAILAADVAEYSRLMGADEEGTHERLQGHLRELIEPKITEHRGRIVKNTGDGLLAEFASVVDAVRCAVAIQRGMVDREPEVPEDMGIGFRIGINLGDIIVDGDDIFGDGVNIAARLEVLAEPGGICVSQVVRDQVLDRLALAFEDMGEQELKNIARPVRVYRIAGSAPSLSSTRATPTIQVSGFLTGKPSVAVLPFANMSSEPEQEFLADGIAEDVTTALSRFPSLSVIARNSSFTYKGRAVEVRQIGRELGVRYVLQGNLRKAGNRIRVTAQLIESETGGHVWAERYDRDLADIFAVQDEIAEAVTSAIAPAISEVERQRAMSKPVDILDAWTAYQRGNWHMSRGNVDDNTLSQKFFARAIELNPTLSSAYRGLANAIITGAVDYGVGDLEEAKKESERLTREALALVDDAEGRASLSNILRLCGQMELALAEADKALAANPNLAIAHRARAAVLINFGKYAESIAAARTALRLEPRGPSIAATMGWIALALYHSGDYAGCVEAARQVIHSYPRHTHPYRFLAAALGQLGRIEEAKTALEQAIAIAPGVFDYFVRSRRPLRRPDLHEHFLDGLRKAGWKE